MTDEQLLKLILTGQEKAGEKLDRLSDAVVELKTKVEHWDREREDARDARQKCRAEVDETLHRHEEIHRELGERLSPIETLLSEQEGGRRSVHLVWKIVAGALGTGYLILTAVGLVYHW